MGAVELLVRLLAGKELADLIGGAQPGLKPHLSSVLKGLENFLQFVIGSWFLFLALGGLLMWLFVSLYRPTGGEVLVAIAVPVLFALWFLDLARK
jgi:hypothetical protein